MLLPATIALRCRCYLLLLPTASVAVVVAVRSGAMTIRLILRCCCCQLLTVASLPTFHYRICKSIVVGRLREKKGRRGKEEKRKEEYLFPRAILAGASPLPAGRQRPRVVAGRQRPRVVAGRRHLFSHARRRNVSPRGEKG
ncbi:hypothetical protein BHE74_00059605 [Ensete ventricosum]|nr:hypothetical protein BHE74_00059605 [Ensete ventricosum]